MFSFSHINFITYCDSEVTVLTSFVPNSDSLIGIALFTLSVLCYCIPIWYKGTADSSSDSDSSDLNQTTSLVKEETEAISDITRTSVSDSTNLSVVKPSLLDLLNSSKVSKFDRTSETISNLPSLDVSQHSPYTLDSTMAVEDLNLLETAINNPVFAQSINIDPVITNVLYEYNNNNPVFFGRLNLDNLIIHLQNLLLTSYTNFGTISSFLDFDNAQELGDNNPFATLDFTIPDTLKIQLELNYEQNFAVFTCVSDPEFSIIANTYEVNGDTFVDYDLNQIKYLVDIMFNWAVDQCPVVVEQLSTIATFLNNLPLG